MKAFIFAALMLFTTASSAWWGGYGGYGYGYGGYGMPPWGYGAMGYGYAIPSPSFNYNTVINSTPVIVIQEPNNTQQIYQQPQQQYAPRTNNCYQNNCR
jgi:hypothetical protein